MKNIILYYYNLIIDDIHQTEKTYYFDNNNFRYFFIKYNQNPENLNDIYKLHLILLNNGFYVHQIILNKDNQIITMIEGTPYILLKTIYYKDKINFDMIKDFQKTIYLNLKLENLERFDWGYLWSLKNDNLEYQISQLGQKHPILRDSFSYYIGLGETAIEFVNTIKQEGINKIVSHRRINSSDTTFDLYNPINLIIDNKTRDAAEYFKTSFFNNKDISYDLNNFFKTTYLTNQEYLLFFARMLYPTYYYDIFEQIIKGKKEDKEIKKITKLTSDYEILLKNLYKYYRQNFNIEPIEWLEN